MERILFKEEQRFTQWWLWLIVLGSFAVPLLFIIKDITDADLQSEEYRSLFTSIFIILGMGLFTVVLFVNMKLVTEITSSGIRLKFPPLKWRWRVIHKEEIKRFEVREYSPIKDFGGWGYRKNILRKKDAYNVKGNLGLQLFLQNGKTLLIGTQRKQAIKYAMDKLFAEDGLGEKKEAEKVAESKSWLGGKAKKTLMIFAMEFVIAIVILGIIQLFNL